MIIIDMNQIALASVMMQLRMDETKQVDEGMVRHMILNSIRNYVMQFKSEYVENDADVILAWDSKHYWRRDYYPQYKASRRKGRQESDLDWNEIFGVTNKIRDEIKENLPYKSVEVYGAEADDIIAVVSNSYSEAGKNPIFLDKVMIVSSDKDFIQLHKENVKQWSPVTKQEVNGHDPDTYIKEHVLKGDSGDGVPNVLSPDHTFTDGLRQKPLGKKRIEKMINENMSDWNDEVKRNYQRNYKLINLKNIPKDIESNIIDEVDKSSCGDRSKLLNYFTVNKLKTLTENIGDF
jgi:5'-3' exonuclease